MTNKKFALLLVGLLVVLALFAWQIPQVWEFVKLAAAGLVRVVRDVTWFLMVCVKYALGPMVLGVLARVLLDVLDGRVDTELKLTRTKRFFVSIVGLLIIGAFWYWFTPRIDLANLWLYWKANEDFHFSDHYDFLLATISAGVAWVFFYYPAIVGHLERLPA